MSKTQDLLKKINYIEADIEIQKQILFSIPSEQKAEMEKTVAVIAAKKAEIEILRQQIKEIDPEEFARILIFEKAINEFKLLATTRQFTSITGRNINEPCQLALRDKAAVECLIKACDADGNWTIITLEGEIHHFPQDAVTEKPVETPVH
ncbi:MAG: hypothetical protein KJ630_06035 [Proteobacteria bacterium]|nr:hypothetical protein [Pseudomonadota bacterium]